MSVVVVCGGRDFQDRDVVHAVMDAFDTKDKIGIVIHGACGISAMR